MQRVKTYEDGVRDAAKILTNTAQDLEQGFARRRKEIEADIRNRQLGVGGAKGMLQTDEAKAQTLRGLAGHVLALIWPLQPLLLQMRSRSILACWWSSTAGLQRLTLMTALMS